MRIAIDAAGVEPGHRVVIAGIKRALDETVKSQVRIEPVIYGPKSLLEEELKVVGLLDRNVKVVDSPHIVGMDDEPRDVLLSKPNSSIIKAVKDLASGVVEGFVSMGNSGAVVGACRAYLGKIRWINKPAMAIPLPRVKGIGLLLDAGAVSDPKPGNLLQFAAMGSAFTERVYGIDDPKIGLLNIGTEAHKGNELTRDTYKILAKSPLNFIGNIEGGDLFNDKADIVVTNGFVGNILLKMTESIPSLIQERLSGTGFSISDSGPLADLDYRKYGGATLLGVDGTVVVGHGRSSEEAVARAIRWSAKMVRGKVVEALRDKVFKTRRAIWLTNPFARGESSEES